MRLLCTVESLANNRNGGGDKNRWWALYSDLRRSQNEGEPSDGSLAHALASLLRTVVCAGNRASGGCGIICAGQ
jgi:hypothetical protein